MTEVVKLNEPLVLRCELSEVLLMSCECERINKEDQDFGPYELRYEPSVSETRIKDDSLWSDVKTQVFSLSDSGKKIFDILIVFRLEYRFTGKTPDEQELRYFEASTPVFQAWPYVREIVQNLAQRMQFNPPPLPLIKRKPVDAKNVKLPAKKQIRPRAIKQVAIKPKAK